jgi:hypothetical protein
MPKTITGRERGVIDSNDTDSFVAKALANAVVRMTVSRHQFDHVIAGLRALQARWYTIDETSTSDAIREIACEHGELMTPDEIDAFIEEINK